MTAFMSLLNEAHDRLETCSERLLVRERRPRGRGNDQSECCRSENDQRPRAHAKSLSTHRAAFPSVEGSALRIAAGRSRAAR
jgi:hypothetical protein